MSSIQVQAPPSPEPVAPSGPIVSNSFWSIAWRSLIGRTTVRIAIGWVCFIILIAVFVPFLANARPFTIHINETKVTSYEGGQEHVTVIPAHIEFPIFASLDRVDLIVLCAFAGVVTSLVVVKMTRRIADPNVRGHVRLRWIGITLISAAVISVFIGILRENVNDPRDFRAMVQQGGATSAIFPPLRWGASDMEPLHLKQLYKFPSWAHWLGTDGNGRDALARLLWGTRIVLGIGIIAQVIALVIGVVVGSFMGYFVGRVDLIGMRLVEIFESIPTLFLILTFVAIYGRDIFIIMVILGLTGWTGIARYVRAEFLKLRKLDFVHAAVAAGLPLHRVLFRHIMPNGLTPVIVSVTFGVAGTVMIESTLSYLGVGVEPPTPSWGSMLFEAGNPAETFRWWLAIAPGFMIFLTVFAYNIIGEGLRDAIDPRTNKVI